MRPVITEIRLPWGGSLPLHSYGLMIVIGFLLGIYLCSREARRRGLPDFMYDFGLVMLLAGLLGGRVWYYVENYSEKYAGESFLEFFKIWKGGLVFYGGAVGGVLGGLVYLWKRRLPVGPCLDTATVGIPLAMAFGRVGCFLNGCCFGLLTRNDFPLGVTFPVGSPAHEAQWALGLLDVRDMKPLPVHPVQLYQASHDLLLFLLLFWYLRRPTTPVGIGMPLLVVLYGVGRFFLEGLRGDQASTFSGLTVGQNSSLVLVAVSGTFLAFMLVKMRKGLGVGVRIPKKTI